MSGHVFFKERWYGFDDGLYTGARLLEILSRSATRCRAEGAAERHQHPELNIKMAEGEPFALLDELKASARFTDAEE